MFQRVEPSGGHPSAEAFVLSQVSRSRLGPPILHQSSFGDVGQPPLIFNSAIPPDLDNQARTSVFQYQTARPSRSPSGRPRPSSLTACREARRLYLIALARLEHRLFPNNPGPLTSVSSPRAFEIIQCRLSNCTVSSPWFSMVTRYVQKYCEISGDDLAGRKMQAGSTLTAIPRVFAVYGARSAIKIA